MDNLCCWNVRGLNGLTKQKEVHNFFLSKKIGLAGLVETKVKSINFPNVY